MFIILTDVVTREVKLIELPADSLAEDAAEAAEQLDVDHWHEGITAFAYDGTVVHTIAANSAFPLRRL